MSNTIFKAADACREMILTLEPGAEVACTSRIYPSTGNWYVQAHARMECGRFLVVYQWCDEENPTLFSLETEEEFKLYIDPMYNLSK